jgi:hypothetical protein
VTPDRLLMATLASAALVLGAPSVAAARVLVHAPQSSLRCGKSIRTGVWYQSFTGGPRTATITIRTITGRVVMRRRVRATATRWQYFFYRPRCNRRYVVTYSTSDGPVRFRVRVRAPS